MIGKNGKKQKSSLYPNVEISVFGTKTRGTIFSRQKVQKRSYAPISEPPDRKDTPVADARKNGERNLGLEKVSVV